MRLGDILKRAAQQPDGRGIQFLTKDGQSDRLTYLDLLLLGTRVANGLHALGVPQGRHAIIVIDSKREFLISFWACVLAGVVPLACPVPSEEQSNDSLKLLAAWEILGHPPILTSRVEMPLLKSITQTRHEACRLLEVEALAETTMESSLGAGTPEDVVMLLSTSGSAGAPKLVMHTHRTVLAYCSAASCHNHFTAHDVSLNWLPFDHVGGLVMFHLRDTWLGCEQVHAPTAAVLARPLRWLDWIDRYRVSITWAPNFAFALVTQYEDEILKSSWDLSCLRFILNGGEPIVPAQARRFMRLLHQHGLPEDAMHPAWGMSETCSGVVYSHEFPVQDANQTAFAEVGLPVPGFRLRVVDANGHIVEQGVRGDLEVCGDSVTPGYYRNRSANLESFSHDGWFRTGDLALVQNGRLIIMGRSKDVIIINGRNYASVEFEAVAAQVPGVIPSLVAAVSVQESGGSTERVAIVFVPDPQHVSVKQGVAEAIRRSIIRTFHCASVTVRAASEEDLPRTSTGKIRRAELREILKQEAVSTDDVKFADMKRGRKPCWNEMAKRTWTRKKALPKTLRQPRTLTVASDRVTLSRVMAVVRSASVAATGACGTVFDDFGPRPDFSLDLNAECEWDKILRTWSSEAPVEREVVFVVWDGAADDDDALLASDTQGGLASLIAMVRSLCKQRSAESVRLRVVAFTRATNLHPRREAAIAALGAWLRSAHAELMWLVTSLTIVRGALEEASAQAALRAELGSADVDDEVAYIEGERYVPRLSPFTHAGVHQHIEAGGLYLVTGALGGLGLHLANHLLRLYAVKLLLVGRTQHAALGEGCDRLRELEKLGAVIYHSANVSDFDALLKGRHLAEERWRTPLRGVFHLAGVLADGSVAEQSFASVQRALEPKTIGTNVLRHLMADRNPGLIVLFSSITGAFGGSGIAAHAAACAYQDRIAEVSVSDENIFSIGWSSWKNTGQNRARLDIDLVTRRGFLTLEPAYALNYFDDVMTRMPGAYIAGIDPNNANIGWQYAQKRPRCYDVVESRSGALSAGQQYVETAHWNTTTVGSNAFSSSWRGSRSDERISGALRDIWCDVLKINVVLDDQNFFDLGGHSLVVPRVVEEIQRKLGVVVEPVDLFRYPTILTLASRVRTLALSVR
jgi:acyl-CoA synthetase (AMP-forming)/AMP-acid ligase II/NADP-dependent 3-hydroxy acid dehydrogenase YdfG